MAVGIDALASDGCTGFQLLELVVPIRTCCEVHDAGGSDGVLLDCLLAATPVWSWGLVGLCVALMLLFRPIYHLLKPTIERIRRGFHARD